MVRRIVVILLIAGILATLVVSAVSHLCPFGFQATRCSLSVAQGRLSLQLWRPGRSPDFVPPATLTELSADPSSRAGSRLTPGARIVVLGDGEAWRVDATVVQVRQDEVMPEGGWGWRAEPFRPAIRTTVWLAVAEDPSSRLGSESQNRRLILAVDRRNRRSPPSDPLIATHRTVSELGAGGRWVHLAAWRSVSLWKLLAAALVLTGVVWAVALARLVRTARRELRGLCPVCGYDLRGSRLRCPECNAPFPQGAARRKIETVHRGAKLAACVVLVLAVAMTVMTYFGTWIRYDRSGVMLRDASVRVYGSPWRVGTPKTYYRRLPWACEWLPKLQLRPFRLSVPTWIPIAVCGAALYWSDIRPRRKGSAHSRGKGS